MNMGDTINKVYSHALHWQALITWIKVNLGYIQSELTHMAATVEADITEAQALVSEWEAAITKFSGLEMAFFRNARTAERMFFTHHLELLFPPLYEMRGHFRPETARLDEVVQSQPAAAVLDTFSWPAALK
jgi:hypothetical protein